MLLLSGASAGAFLVGCSTDHGASAPDAPASAESLNPDCVLTPDQAEGPFYDDLNLVRRDVTDGKPGSPLQLDLIVIDASTCEPIPDATVDVWHADAGGLYSAFPEQGDDEDVDTSGESFLRGMQPTDAAGLATIDTIYPGWYPDRTTHIHIKVRVGDNTRVTSQLYFPDETTESVYRTHPAYVERGSKDTPNDDDFGGTETDLRMTVTASGDGHVATHTIGIRR
ncbi:MAG: hypothetical protein AAF567_17225 [Actinomycetota bacterium]